jgi:predicted metal-dependent peptidase
MGVMPMKRLELDVLIDVSGSISDETVAKILAALQHSSRLRRVRVVVFSESAAAVPRNDPRLVAQVVRGLGGGGTLFGPAAELRRPGVPTIWVTDGYLSDQWPAEHPGGDGWIIIQHGATPPPHSGTLLYHEEEE